jgi:ribosomal protein S21
MALPPFSSPKTLFADLRAFFRTRQRHELIFAGFAVLIPTVFSVMFLSDSRPVAYKPPEVIFVKQWNKGRTDAEVKRQQAIDEPAERAARKAEAEFEAKKRKQFQDIEKALGI